jgi:uncharacterized cupredoxin-like copper-binding protein
MVESRKVASVVVAPLLLVALAFTACGGNENSVDVTLQEFSVGAEPAAVSAGSVTFDVTNDGPNDVHEFVVIATELSLTDLPTAEDGSVDEDGEGIEVVNELEEIPVGETETLTVDLDAGPYVLICNIVEEEDGEVESHYQEGMRASFTVE